MKEEKQQAQDAVAASALWVFLALNPESQYSVTCALIS